MKSTALYPYHTRVSNFIADKQRVGIFTFFGGGKTYLSLKWLEDLSALGYEVFPTLVLVMKSLIDQWGEQIEEHSNFTYKLVQGTAEKRIQAFKAPADIYIANYDILRSPKIMQAAGISHRIWTTVAGKVKHSFKKDDRGSFSSVIIDESTMLKEARTQRFKVLYALCKDVPQRAILTGKPILEQAEEIFAQALFLDDGKMFGKSFWKFRDTYFAPGPPWSPYEWQLKDGAAKRIADKLSTCCIRIPKSEIASQLPPKLRIQIHFKFSKSVQQRYTQLRKKFSMELLEGGEFQTQWAVVKAQKMHEICAGIFYTPDGQYELVHTLKLDWLRENVPLMLKEGPILIWTNFVRLLPLIAAALAPIPLRIYRGSDPDSIRKKAVNDFQQGVVDVLVLSQKAGYAGLNLQRANQAVFVSTDYSAGDRENAEDRCHRIGSEMHDTVTYYDLVIENSIDTVIRDVHKNKLNMAEAILKHIQEG